MQKDTPISRGDCVRGGEVWDAIVVCFASLALGSREYQVVHGLLLVHQKEDKKNQKWWKLVIPDVPKANKKIMEELHIMSYSRHLSY